MPDPWDVWDQRVKATGREKRVAEELSDTELLNLLATDRATRRDVEKHILKDEALARMRRPRAAPPLERAPGSAPAPLSPEGAGRRP